jgi:hypothetical protein
MGRLRRIAIGLAVVAIATVGVGGAASTAGAVGTAHGPDSSVQRGVPDAIKVPDGNTRIAAMPARGVQTHRCTAGTWTFLQPDAILRHHGRPQVLHTVGPVWTFVVDGSSVTATAQASSPVPNAIPQLLLKSASNRGPGLLSAVTYIQRLNTTGGLAPTGTCSEGTTASVPYTARYTFWVADAD